ncbi:MAG: hypothetical protein P1U72_09860 [Paracoccaceae bacterium]|nr:hypothetical protein [Paracoccaceae bacterium]
MTEKKTGRPQKYTEAQVIEGIEIAERNGDIPSGDSVKKAMCEELGVAGGINAQSLDKEVHRLLEERVRQRRSRLIAALPSATLEAVKEVGALVEAAMLNHMGEEHNKLRAINGKKLTEINVDLANQREQIRRLLSRIDAKDAEIADLEGERDDALLSQEGAVFASPNFSQEMREFSPDRFGMTDQGVILHCRQHTTV